MSLINRITRLFKADLHAVLDVLEEPETILKQSVREMETIVEQGEAQLEHLAHQDKALIRRQARFRREGNEIEQHIDFCFAEGNDSLARASVRKKLETDRLLEALTEQHAAVSRRRAELCARLDDQKQQLRDILDQLEWISEEQRQHGSGTPEECAEPTGSRAAVSEEAVELAFLQEKRRRVQKTGDKALSPDS
jgi:phage shock protein A